MGLCNTVRLRHVTRICCPRCPTALTQMLDTPGLPRVWLTVVMTSGGQFVSVFESEFELDGGESAEAALASPPIVGPFDPNDDLDS